MSGYQKRPTCRLKGSALAMGLMSLLLFSFPSQADTSRTTKGALLGATAGILSGNGINGAFKGAALGAGVGAVTERGHRGQKARKGAKIGAAAGAVVGVLSGDGIEGALKGAVVGGAGGAILGRMR